MLRMNSRRTNSEGKVLFARPGLANKTNEGVRTLFIVGPTASGKTALALQLAAELGGEIICADSRTIYKGLDVATAKPTKAERAQIPHYGLDLINPDEKYSAGQFQKDARGWLDGIHGRDKIALVVGGTGLYIDGLYYNFNFNEAYDETLRTEMEGKSVEELHEYMAERSIALPENSHNKRYLIRTIERGGKLSGKGEPLANSLVIGLLPNRETLDDRIRLRGHTIIAVGAVEEAERLFEQYGYNVAAASAPFYKAFAAYCRGEADADSCLERFYLNDRQLSKRQITWFKRNMNIHWFETAAKACNFVHSSIKA